MNESLETNFDSLLSVTRVQEIEAPALIQELIREVTRLRQEVA